MIGPDAGRRQFQCRAIRRADLGTFRSNLVGRKGQRFGRQGQPVKPGGQVDHRLITARPHIGDDGGDGLIHILRLFPLHSQQGGKAGFELRVARGQKDGHGDTPLGASHLARAGRTLKHGLHRCHLGQCTQGTFGFFFAKILKKDAATRTTVLG